MAATRDGLVAGVLGQSSCNREEAKDGSAGHEGEKARPIEEKGRFRRLEALERSTADMPRGVKVATVCDREGDVYELFAKAGSLREPALIRIVQSRMTIGSKRMPDGMRKKRCQGRVEARLPRDSRSGRRYRGCGARHIQ
jgi:hypothetical protein